MNERRKFLTLAVIGSAGCLISKPARPNAKGTMEKVTSKDGTVIAFERKGQGPALILVGGALSDRSGGTPFVDHLAPRFTVFSYDRRGRGDSKDTAPYAVEREVEDIEALVDAAGGSAFVYGKSSGAVLALEATRRLPSKIRKLALYEPPFIVDDSRPPPPSDYVKQVNDLTAAGRRGDAVEYFLTKVVGMPGEAVAPMRKAPTWPALEALAHTLAYDIAIMKDTMTGKPLPRQRWAAAAVPTLVMDGGASPPWMRKGAKELASVLPRAQHRTLEGQTHDVKPEVLGPVLSGFFVG